MAVSTVFLQTTEDETNSFADTTFHIDLPMLLPTYKLSVATFMFRPAIILGENEYIKVRFKLERDVQKPINYPETRNYKFGDGEWGVWQDQVIESTIPVGMLEYNSGFDVTTLTELLTKKVKFTLTDCNIKYTELTKKEDGSWNDPPKNDAEHTYKVIEKDGKCWYYDEKVPVTVNKNDLTIQIACEKTMKNQLKFDVHKVLYYVKSNDRCWWNLTSFEIAEVSPALRHLTGITPDVSFEQVSETIGAVTVNYFKANMHKPFNPQYWNYITLTCNKVYNTATIVNQTRYNVQPNEATEFYKCQIMGYMVNQSPSPTFITTGVPTSNEYLITPSDFNSIRFNLHFDNGEPVKLYSPMTIVLNISPV